MPFRGWQRQTDAYSVQEKVEAALLKICKTPVSANGCGRTDAQVHASQFFFHADLEIRDVQEILPKLNDALGPEIALFDIIPVDDKASARFDAIHRTYDYFIHTHHDPFLHDRSALYDHLEIDPHKMAEGVALLPSYDDYYAFCKSPESFNTTICRVSSAVLFANEGADKFRFQITANRFLTGMIRIIMGRLLELANGRMSLDQFEHHLANKKTPKILSPAYPQGLYLSKVVYPYLDIVPRAAFLAFPNVDGSSFWKPVMV
ncbi:MAG: hypothetical protein R3A50_06025 [Saprospiraceae bacterium]|nr:hypothetical protein [Saprospiraceae bacterium]